MKNRECSICGNNINKFRDELSKKEYQITGLCQRCQDKIFADWRFRKSFVSDVTEEQSRNKETQNIYK